MVSTRSRVSTTTITFSSLLPLTVLSAAKIVSQEKKKSSLVVTPSPASRKRRRTTKTDESSSSPNKNKNDATAKKELNFATTLTPELVASINPDQKYIDLVVPPAELRPSATLTTGQCFHWKAVVAIADEDENGTIKKESAWGTHDATEWVGIIRLPDGRSCVLAIRETPSSTLYRPLTTTVPTADIEQYLRSYFRLDDSLGHLYQKWSKADDRLATIAKCIPGVRILEQDPFECLISFICSSNNNIPRITKMVNSIRANYGEELLTIGDEKYYSFPSSEDLLAKGNDDDFRKKCGLGYRSKYILETLQILKKHGGEEYLRNFRSMQDDPNLVQEKLCEFCGVGRKVADCVALFSLRQDDAIPVDVHVWNIARRDYDPGNALEQVKSLSPTTYKQVGDLFRSRFPDKAGWAHSLLFVAELPSFRPVLPSELIAQMDQYKQEEELKKKEAAAVKKKKKEEKKK
ncbi:unnamed protein product [Cylindrotheca closterium]|uniref:DNA-(apurinic or apyrimidinic site) lyase n=1 Tax=Cylindrotheca closterium TaxID=2856 RepID=A0AAD2FP62_9STRA|nr:unnamed protein product [Cylindrotheca closterium]